MRDLFDSPPFIILVNLGRSTESVEKVINAGSSSIPGQRKEEKGAGYLAEGEGEREREDSEVDARP